MRIVRANVFETNSSSTHSITMCLESEYEKWKNGELYYIEANEDFVTPEQAKEILREMTLESRFDYKYNSGDKKSTYTYKGITVDYDNKSQLLTKENLAEITDEDIEEYVNENFDRYEMPCKFDEYWDNLEYETYHTSYTTKSGEVVTAFGYYGNDY